MNCLAMSQLLSSSVQGSEGSQLNNVSHHILFPLRNFHRVNVPTNSGNGLQHKVPAEEERSFSLSTTV